MKKKNIEEHLYRIASLQQGYFTSYQAKKAGYSDSRFAYHVRAGNWIREGRGIYRLANYPVGERPDLVYWSLWSTNRQGEVEGVFSHQTALSIHELSDAMPAKYSMTVSKKFRRYHPPPENLVLYFANLSQKEIWEFEGYKVTSPKRTIQDVLLDESCPEELVIQGIIDGLRKGVITQDQIFEFQANLQSDRTNRILKTVTQDEK